MKKSRTGKGLGKQLSGQKEELAECLGERAWHVGRSSGAGWARQ